MTRQQQHNVCMKVPDLQGDSGANCHATNSRHYLWDFKYIDPIDINTYDAEKSSHSVLQATGTGILRIISDNNAVMECQVLFIPNANGTIVSPDKFMIDTAAVSFCHEGTQEGTGKMTWRNATNQVIVSVTMKRRQGLWYIVNPILIPPKPTIQVTSAKSVPSESSLRALLLWHHRLGHPSNEVLRQTQKVVHGIPSIPRQFDRIFYCPSCQQSKLTQVHTGPSASRQPFLPGTMFHMDFGFVSGPINLQDTVQGHKAQSLIPSSIDGSVTYLLIIDAASRYIWTFPLASKHPPLDLVDSFLARFGRPTNRKISTDPNNLLAISQSWRKICATHGYDIVLHSVDCSTSSAPTSDRVVRTDNGTELAGSTEFRNTVHRHGYLTETTAPAASFQNGMAERPHRTLKDKVRCMLYAAGLPAKFWSYALLHATWIYNRLYHSTIKQTPFEAWTKTKPTLDGLLTFGSPIVAKRPKQRSSSLDPNTYKGVFLGYRSTTDNILFYDVIRKCVSTARHFSCDEFQFGEHPTERSPAGHQLLSTYYPNQDAPHVTTLPLSDDQHWITTSDGFDVPADLLQDHSPCVTAMTAQDSDSLWRDIKQFDVTLSPHDRSTTEIIPTRGRHPTLEIDSEPHPDYTSVVILSGLRPGSTAHRAISAWRTRLFGSIISSIDGVSITSPSDIAKCIKYARQKSQSSIKIIFSHSRWSSMTGTGIPQLHFDQLNVVCHHLEEIKSGKYTPLGTDHPPLLVQLLDDLSDTDPDTTDFQVTKVKSKLKVKLRRSKLQQQPDWQKFLESEYNQLNKYQDQGMFGTPIPRPHPTPEDPDPLILDWVWAYCYKLDPVTLEEKPKSRGTCNGSRITELAQTFASCLEQTIHRLFWSIVAVLNLVCIGCDVTNAFGEADKPDRPFYMRVDPPFQDWWTNHMKRPRIPPGYVVPIEKNLQGHPEAPRQWNRHIHRILLDKLGFHATVQEPCFYYGQRNNQVVLILRQVDDFLIASVNQDICLSVKKEIAAFMSNPMHELGYVIRFNGLDICQSRHYIKLHASTYITKITENHQWQDLPSATLPVPMRSDSSYQTQLDTTKGPDNVDDQKELERQMGFSYRQLVGELIFAMTTCRPDISSAIIRLAQHSDQPAKCHYQAAKSVLVYLFATRDHGIYYWRPAPNMTFEEHSLPAVFSSEHRLQQFPQMKAPNILEGASDATWADSRLHRRSTSGVVILLAGGTVYFKTRVQPTVALSSTEAELVAMTDAGKAALYLRSILDEIGIPQNNATTIYGDNQGALHITSAQHPTRRTRHVDIKQFAVIQWSDDDILNFSSVSTENNISDSLSKVVGRIKFYEQMDVVMGRRPPSYTNQPLHRPVSAIVAGTSLETKSATPLTVATILNKKKQTSTTTSTLFSMKPKIPAQSPEKLHELYIADATTQNTDNEKPTETFTALYDTNDRTQKKKTSKLHDNISFHLGPPGPFVALSTSNTLRLHRLSTVLEVWGGEKDEDRNHESKSSAHSCRNP